MSCMCGDTYCYYCGPAQGNYRCEVCGKWAADGGCDDPEECAKIDIEIAIMNQIQVHLQYFKHTGKYYADGEMEVPGDMAMYEIFKLVRKRQREGNLPGVNRPGDYYIVVDVPAHPHNHPAIILPEKIEKFIKNPLVSNSF